MSATSSPVAAALSFAGQCDRGKVRAENQDSVRQAPTPLGDLMIVADGIGGYEGGAVASGMAVAVISASLEGMPAFFPIDIAIEEAVCRANAEIAAAAAEPDTPNNRMGTTVVLALLRQDPENAQAAIQAWIGHVGDSRAYLLHNRRLKRITRDHSAIQLLLDHNLIDPAQARNHPDASVLTRTLGHEPNVKVDLNSIELEPGDTLLLCSDGLWGYVADEEIERVLADPDLSPDQASRALLDLALDAGGYDNVGIQLARLVGTAAAPLQTSRAADANADSELLSPYLLVSRLRDPFAEPAEPPEAAPPAQSEVAPPAKPTIESAAALAMTLPVAEPETLPTPPPGPMALSIAEPEAAPASEAASGQEPVFWLESTLKRQLPQNQVPEERIFEARNAANWITESAVPEIAAPASNIEKAASPEIELPVNEIRVSEISVSEVRESEIHESEIRESTALDPQFPEWQPATIPTPRSESEIEAEVPEPRKTTIRGIVKELWEMFVYPLGRDYDFAPEWHTDFTSWYAHPEKKQAGPHPPALPSLVAGILVTCAASPRRESENIAEPEPNLHSRFKSSASEVSTLLKYLGVLLLAFCASCGVVYCALFQNWFGIDHFLHLL